MALLARRSLPQYPRPERRADCEPGGWNAQRPCPFAACKHHLAVGVRTYADGRSVITHVRPGWSGDDSAPINDDEDTCALDFADAPATGAETGRILGLSRQLVDLIENRAYPKLLAFARGVMRHDVG
jgi:hypothetical protein